MAATLTRHERVRWRFRVAQRLRPAQYKRAHTLRTPRLRMPPPFHRTTCYAQTGLAAGDGAALTAGGQRCPIPAALPSEGRWDCLPRLNVARAATCCCLVSGRYSIAVQPSWALCHTHTALFSAAAPCLPSPTTLPFPCNSISVAPYRCFVTLRSRYWFDMVPSVLNTYLGIGRVPSFYLQHPGV